MATQCQKKEAIRSMVKNLSKENFRSFRSELLGRKDGPNRWEVEHKGRLVIIDVLVRFYTPDRAPGVAAEILREIGCEEEAQLLDERTGGQSSAPGRTAPSSAGPPAVADNGCTGEHFVDKHRVELIKRVGDIETIMDELLDKKVISKGIYAKIRAIPTSREKMRELYCGHLNAEICKDIFYEILEKHQSHLIAELKKKK